MGRKSRRRPLLGGVMVMIVVVIAAISFVPRLAARAFVALVDPAPFWRLRFEVLPQTPKGLNYIRLHDEYFPSIWQVMVKHQEMDVQALEALAQWSPNVEAFVNGHGYEVTVTESQAQRLIDFLDLLLQYGDPALVDVIQQELAATPLEPTVGMTMNEAWAYLNQDPRFPTQNLDRIEAPDLSSAGDLTAWVLPESPGYAIRYDLGLWEILEWNNGAADYWQLTNIELPACVITAPRQINDPFTRKYVSNRMIGTVEYFLQEARFATRIEELTQYTLYQPRPAGWDPHYPGLIVYPDALDREQCRLQSEQVLATLYRWDTVTVTPTPSPLP